MWVRRLERGLRRAEARLRRWLPPALGGRFRAQQTRARRLTVEDAPALTELYDDPAVGAAFIGADPRTFYVGVFVGGRLAAAGAVGPIFENRGIPGEWLGGALVAPHLRRRGLGQILHRSRLAEAARAGIDRVYGSVRADNAAALAALRAVGFERSGRPEWEATLTRALGAEQVVLSATTGVAPEDGARSGGRSGR